MCSTYSKHRSSEIVVWLCTGSSPQTRGGREKEGGGSGVGKGEKDRGIERRMKNNKEKQRKTILWPVIVCHISCIQEQQPLIMPFLEGHFFYHGAGEHSLKWIHTKFIILISCCCDRHLCANLCLHVCSGNAAPSWNITPSQLREKWSLLHQVNSACCLFLHYSYGDETDWSIIMMTPSVIYLSIYYILKLAECKLHYRKGLFFRVVQ